MRLNFVSADDHKFKTAPSCALKVPRGYPSFESMSTYVQLLYHVVFATKGRARVLQEPGRTAVFKYIWGITKNLDSVLYRIGGVEDHLHILVSLHPTISPAHFVKTVKVASSKWIKEQGILPLFSAWQDGYAAFTHSLPEKDALVEYIKNQPEHHRTKTFLEEYRDFLEKAALKLDERYLP
jgi:REP element-mobilizing transposase RayT